MQAWLEHVWYAGTPPPWWLRPWSLLYAGAAGLRRLSYARRWRAATRLPAPVLIVGNLSVGGTGKTPLVHWLVERLRERGLRPGIVSRGYGGSTAAVRLIDAADDPGVVGDETVLLATRTQAPVAVGRDRPAAARLLTEAGCDVIVSDDGLQHYALARDCEIVVVDGERRFGNGWRLPAGPLRESPARLRSADAVVVNGGASPDGRPRTARALEGALTMRLEGDCAVSVHGAERRPLADFAGREVHAVAGIGNPERFFELLRVHGISITRHPLPDHARLRSEDISFPDEHPVLMTEKDAVKCRELSAPRHWYVPVTASFETGASKQLMEIVMRAIERRRARA
jgi:tetraacyldisaccharide 4'-kinase